MKTEIETKVTSSQQPPKFEKKTDDKAETVATTKEDIKEMLDADLAAEFEIVEGDAEEVVSSITLGGSLSKEQGKMTLHGSNGKIEVLNRGDQKDLEYFSCLPSERQAQMLASLGISKFKFHEVVEEHRKASLKDVDKAIEKMKAEQLLSKPAEKSRAMEARYKIQIDKFIENGIKAEKIAEWLTKADQANHPKGKCYTYSASLVKAFVAGLNSKKTVGSGASEMEATK